MSRRNFNLMQLDAVGVGIANAASTFLPVFLSRNSATTLEISLLSIIPAVAGFLFAIPFGRFLQRSNKIAAWYGWTRFFYIAGFLLTGLLPFIFSRHDWVGATLVIWSVIAIPQTILSITFSVVMNRVGGEDGRYELMARRWSILGIITALFVFLSGQFLKLVRSPLNFQLTFMILSLGGVIALMCSLKLEIPSSEGSDQKSVRRNRSSLAETWSIVTKNKLFISTVIKRLVFLSGVSFGTALFTLHYIREVKASNAWIAAFSTVQTLVTVLGYLFWSHMSRKNGTRTILRWTTLAVALFPIGIALTKNNWLIAGFCALAGLFQAGLDLVLFDELMSTFPAKNSSTYISFSQSLQYLVAIIFPLLGTLAANRVGIPMALIFSGLIKLAGFSLVLFERKESAAKMP